MKLRLESEVLWFNRMPTLNSDGHSVAVLGLSITPDDVLPEGDYEVEVTLKGPDGKSQTAKAPLRVSHAH